MEKVNMVLTITYPEYPSIQQTTWASLSSHWSLQTVPQVLYNISTRPPPECPPATSLYTSACHKLSKFFSMFFLLNVTLSVIT